MKSNSNPLTKTQRRVLDFVRSYLDANGYPPTRSEIAKRFKWGSLTAAQGHLILIQKKGYIKLLPTISRGIQIL